MIAAVSVLAILAGVFLVTTIAFYALYAREKGKNAQNEADKVKVVDGVRYSLDDAVTREGEANVTLQKGDVLLRRGVSYTAKKGSALLPGTYTALAASDAAASFKLRAGGAVRSYNHGDTLVLAEGEEVCAVSCNVILR